jgi:hypothetical protein
LLIAEQPNLTDRIFLIGEEFFKNAKVNQAVVLYPNLARLQIKSILAKPTSDLLTLKNSLKNQTNN